MENDTRIVKAVAYIENAVGQMHVLPFRDFNRKQAISALRNAKTLLRNTKSDLRMEKIEREMELLKELVRSRR
jgi:hypothetical protein